MSSDGKYVRAPEFHSDSDDSDGGWLPRETNSGLDKDDDRYLSSDSNLEVAFDGHTGIQQESEGGKQHDQNAAAMREENRSYLREIKELKHSLNQLVEKFNSRQPLDDVSVDERDHTWSSATEIAGPSKCTGNMRWEHIPPFPNDVPANQMWEQWNRFIDRFQIAASISNVSDPVKRSQILFLSLGDKLQGIVRAARLRPSLQDPNCYKLFVENIEQYLLSMIDITAEHEKFNNLKQGADEPTMAYHARLMENVQLCRFKRSYEDRFVRMQLLKGMRNRELAKLQ